MPFKLNCSCLKNTNRKTKALPWEGLPVVSKTFTNQAVCLNRCTTLKNCMPSEIHNSFSCESVNFHRSAFVACGLKKTYVISVLSGAGWNLTTPNFQHLLFSHQWLQMSISDWPNIWYPANAINKWNVLRFSVLIALVQEINSRIKSGSKGTRKIDREHVCDWSHGLIRGDTAESS